MTSTVSRAAGIALLALLLVGAYTLISSGSTTSGINSNAKFEPKKPPQFSTTMMEGSMI